MLPSGGYENSISGAWPQSLEQPEASLGKKQLSWRTWAWVHIMDLIPCLVDKHDEDVIEESTASCLSLDARREPPQANVSD